MVPWPRYPIETLAEMKSAADGVDVNGSQGDESTAPNFDGDDDGDSKEKGDVTIGGEIFQKDGSFVAVAVESKREKEADGKLEETPVRYSFRLQEYKTRSGVDDLVWGHATARPWWPGQIFDPTYASETAAFYRLNGLRELAVFVSGGGLEESNFEIKAPPSARTRSDEKKLQSSVTKRNLRKGAYRSSKIAKENEVASEDSPCHKNP